MKKCSKKNLILLSLTLFSMFFGAGNLIFPPFLGQNAGVQSLPALIGFLITAVGFPVLGIAVVSRFNGLDVLAQKVHAKFGLFFAVLIYLSIGPLLATPRTATLPFEMAIMPLLPEGASTQLSLLLFTAGFFLIAWLLSRNPSKLVDHLGKILTPVLLLLILAVFAAALLHPLGEAALPQPAYASAPLIQGFLEGYLTMDALAALNFGIVVSLNIRALGITDDQEVMSTSMKAGCLAGIILAVIYIMLTMLGTSLSSMPIGANGAQTLTLAVTLLFGESGRWVMAFIFLLACMTTCVGLLTSCSEFFSSLTPKINYSKWLLFLTLFALAVSNFGLSTILSISVPVLNMLYPMALVLILLGLGDPLYKANRLVYPLTIFSTGIVSVLSQLDSMGFRIPGLTNLLNALPLASQSLGWITIALIMFIVALLAGRQPQRKPR